MNKIKKYINKIKSFFTWIYRAAYMLLLVVLAFIGIVAVSFVAAYWGFVDEFKYGMRRFKESVYKGYNGQ